MANVGGAFGVHDYEIEYAWAGQSMEINVRARMARPLAVGDLYTVGGDKGPDSELVVVELTYRPDGAWNARCRILEA